MRSTGSSAGQKLHQLMILLPLILILPLLIAQADRARAAVTLISFTATGREGYILVEWETASELDNAGFFVQASNQELGSYTRIGEFIFSQGDGLTGATYSYSDAAVTPGVVRWYKLESVANNQTSELSAPASAVASQLSTTATSTPTATATPTTTLSSTSTHTPTPTETSSSGYPGPATPTSPYPGIPTTVSPYLGVPTTIVPVQAFTPTPDGSVNQASTPIGDSGASGTVLPQEQQLAIPDPDSGGTLAPLPEIAIQFPEDSAGTPDLNILANPGLAKEDPQAGSSASWSRYGTLGFVLLIWTLLGGWFWFTFRKIE
jgi:hypothetical protein